MCDYGSFISLADKLGETFKKVYYHSPVLEEFQSIELCCKGDGLERVERLDDFWEPDKYDEIDLFVFPDIGWGGSQRFLRRAGKLVWGSMGADELELYRTRFLKTIKELGLPVVNSVKVKGLTNLANHLKQVKDKWVKINRYRANMETWHHLDWQHSERKLEEMAVTFGGLKEHVVFVVQDDLPEAIEIGYDGWTVDGKFPSASFQGYEKKNELYLGSRLDYEDLPEYVRQVNEAMAPVLRQYQYRNFMATEIRVLDDTPYFIDPTMRMPGQTGEQLLQTCKNLAEVVYHGAAGELVEPEFVCEFAAEATLHYTADGEWKVLKVPEKIRDWFKGYHYCEADGALHFPPHKSDEVGVVIGIGDTIEDAIGHLFLNKSNFGDEPISAETAGFVNLLNQINKAEKEGIEFTDQKIPEPATVLEDS